jgi:hypothetical protein
MVRGGTKECKCDDRCWTTRRDTCFNGNGIKKDFVLGIAGDNIRTIVHCIVFILIRRDKGTLPIM